MSETPVPPIELTVVMPCLNEADTLAVCIQKAQRAMKGAGIAGQIIVADNGSTDDSVKIANELGARVVPVAAKGYGNALMGGIEAAESKFVLMGDADDSYDFLEIPKFVEALRKGPDLVQGCRLPTGGGTVMAGAMPWSHRWIGNPLFSRLARTWFKAPIHDIYCGMRGFTKTLYERLKLRCTGMEFATEMIIKSSLYGEAIAEVPISLHPDGRKAHKPHLRTIRDGWRTLRFFLMYSPRALFLVPGLGLTILGVLGYLLAMPRATIGGVTFDAHTLLFATVAILIGYQAILFWLFVKSYADTAGLAPIDALAARIAEMVALEKGLIVGLAFFLTGVILLGVGVYGWYRVGWGALDYAQTMRWVIPGAGLTAIGSQTVLASFFLGVLHLGHR